jgi:hypothetical protein
MYNVHDLLSHILYLRLLCSMSFASEMDMNHRVFHTALDNHTGVIKQLAQKTSAQSQGLLDHKEHIETTLEALQQQNLELEQHALS